MSGKDGNEKEIVGLIKKTPGYQWTPLPPGDRAGKYGDGLFRCSSWPCGDVWHVEIKTEKGTLSPKQLARHNEGWTVVIRSFDELVELVNKREIYA